MDRPRPWMRYVDASDLCDTDIDFDGLPVQNAAGDRLGTVDGFIIDADDARLYYVVVDAGGWFKSKEYLIPVGHARFDAANRQFFADLTRERIDRFPGFDKDKFHELSDEELERIDLHTASACCPDDLVAAGTKSWSDRWSHYEQPDWWQSNYYRPDHAGGGGVTAGAEWSGRESTHRDGPATVHDGTNRRR